MGKAKRFNKKNAKRLVLEEKPLKPFLNARNSSYSSTSLPSPTSPPVVVDKRTDMTRLSEELDVDGFYDAWRNGVVDIEDLKYPDPAARGMTPFGVALMTFDKGRRPEALDFVAAMMSRGLDVREPVDRYGSTCLHVLVRQHRDAQSSHESKALKEFYYWLIAQGADTHAKDRGGKIPAAYSIDTFLRGLLEGYG